MAASFTFNGTQYTVDDQGAIRDASGQPIPPDQQNDVNLQAAAAAAAAGTTPSVSTPITPDAPAPGPTLPATPPNPGGLTANASVHQTGTDSLVVPQGATLPAAPPRAGVVGSATELRARKDQLEKQIAEISRIPVADRTREQVTALDSFSRDLTTVTQDITKAEATKDRPASVMRGTGGPDDPFNIIDNGDGTITPSPNPNYTGQIRAQVVSHGNKTFVITPPTREELAANPAAPPHTTVAYTDTDAQQLANRTAANAEAQTRVSAAAQAANAAASAAQTEIAQRVSRGEDAASVRAEVQQKIEQAHQAWVEADGDARRAQTALDSYNAARHNTVLEQQGQQAIDNNAANQARQDATTRYGYDTSAASSRYATDAASHTAKLNAMNTAMGNVLTQLGEINKALPPGSDLAGKALPGLMAYITGILNKTGEPTPPPTDTPPPPEPPAAPAAPATPLTPPPSDAPGGAAVTPPPAPIDFAAASISDPSRGPGLPPPPDFAASSINDPSRAAGPDPSVLAATIGGTADQLAAQNAAMHAQNMAAPTRALAPDGSPIAAPDDVARMFGRGGPA